MRQLRDAVATMNRRMSQPEAVQVYIGTPTPSPPRLEEADWLKNGEAEEGAEEQPQEEEGQGGGQYF